MELLHNIFNYLADTILALGYIGIFILMFIESSFFPFPSEIVIIPAGYLVFQGDMNMAMVIFSGTAGSLGGALFNYYFARRYGLKLLYKYGKYIHLPPARLDKVTAYFKTHGAISTFIGRLLPAVRQYISLPAGISKMDLKIFSFYTVLGAGIWVTVLAYLGYVFGNYQWMIYELIHYILIFLLIICTKLVFIYILINRLRS